jgi:hypothetical protein
MTDDTKFSSSGRQALGLQTVAEDGQVPASRVRSAMQARRDVQLMVEANRARERRWTLIKGMFQLNPPYDKEKLRTKGQAYRFNVPTGEAKGLLSSACSPFYDLFSSGQHYAEIHTGVGNPEERQIFSQIITEEFDSMLKRWDGFDFRMQRLIPDFVGYGRGFLYFESPTGWRFKYVGHESVVIPDGTEVDIESLKTFVVRCRVHPTDLYDKVRDRGSASAAGWNREAVIAAIRKAVPYEPNSTNIDASSIQDQINDADTYTWAKDATVCLANYYVQEFSGRYSHYIVVEDEQLSIPKSASTEPISAAEAASRLSSSEDDSGEDKDFLYRSIGKYEKLHDILCPFIFEVLDNTWNGASGLGKDIFAVMQAKDRLRNSQLDNTMMRQSLLLQAQKASDRQKLGIMQIGPVTIIPENCTPVQANFIGDIETSLAVNRDLDNMLQMNTGVYRPQLEKPQGNPETATAATLRFQAATILGGSAVNRFYRQLDPVYAQIYSRAIRYPDEEAKDFIRRCEERGVPREAIREVRMIRAWRGVGNGSPFLRQQSLGMMAQVASSFPEAGRVAWLRDFVASSANYSVAERYVPAPEIAKRTDDQVAYAMIENDVLNDGLPVLRTGTQNDVIHAQTHLEAMSGAVGSLEQGADPVHVLTFLDAAGAHVMQHIQGLANDELRQGDAKALVGMLKQFAAIADKLRQQIEQQAQAQGQAQEQQALAQQAMSEQQADLVMKQRDLEGKLYLAERKLNETLRMKQEQHEQKLEMAEQKTQADIRMKREKAAAGPSKS